MISTFSTTTDKTTITFKATALTTVIQNIVGSASEYLFNHGAGDHGTTEAPKVFADLTNQQKLDIVGKHLKQVILDCANTNKSVKAQETARSTEEASKYDI